MITTNKSTAHSIGMKRNSQTYDLRIFASDLLRRPTAGTKKRKGAGVRSTYDSAMLVSRGDLPLVYEKDETPVRIQVENNLVSIPQNYSSWATAIEESRYIAGYSEEDEENGQIIYYDPSTWRRSVYLLRDIAIAGNAEGYGLPAPRIYDGPKGSIDIRWKSDHLRLLVNVPADKIQPIRFHGDDINQQMIKGKLHDFEDLVSVLITVLKSV